MEPANITHLHGDNKSSPAGKKEREKKEAAFQCWMAGEPLYMPRPHDAGSALLAFVVDVVFRVSEDDDRAPLFNNVGALLVFFLFFFKRDKVFNFIKFKAKTNLRPQKETFDVDLLNSSHTLTTLNAQLVARSTWLC